MEKPYDFVYLTNTPSFYKMELCRRLAAEGRKIMMVLLGYGSEAVNCRMKEDDRRYWGFDWVFISEGKYQDRDKRRTYKALRRLMRSIRYRKVLFSGWCTPEYNLFAFKSARSKNLVVCESSDLETRTDGLRGWIKRRIIGRMSGGFPSGTPHERLLAKLGLRGRQFVTGSVGIFRKEGAEYHSPAAPLRFLYVGRLTAVKNLPVLIECFNRNGLPLTIVGGGEQESELKAMAKDNIRFTGFIENERLSEIYENHDVFVLPSLSETWGFVVEEALYRGLPCIVSDMVGAGPDMVLATGAGISFRHDSPDDLQCAVESIAGDYDRYAAAARGIDFAARDRVQIDAYHQAVEN
ncbi:MAG: glycosyltransferase family 4 protein [Muribaculaceae bacterium]|nr:glycosyltransferase family 4 protein [Muribaculaceae bacterium]